LTHVEIFNKNNRNTEAISALIKANAIFNILCTWGDNTKICLKEIDVDGTQVAQKA
jgi:hypothetical protein